MGKFHSNVSLLSGKHPDARECIENERFEAISFGYFRKKLFQKSQHFPQILPASSRTTNQECFFSIANVTFIKSQDPNIQHATYCNSICLKLGKCDFRRAMRITFMFGGRWPPPPSPSPLKPWSCMVQFYKHYMGNGVGDIPSATAVFRYAKFMRNAQCRFPTIQTDSFARRKSHAVALKRVISQGYFLRSEETNKMQHTDPFFPFLSRSLSFFPSAFHSRPTGQLSEHSVGNFIWMGTFPGRAHN